MKLSEYLTIVDNTYPELKYKGIDYTKLSHIDILRNVAIHQYILNETTGKIATETRRQLSHYRVYGKLNFDEEGI